MNIFANLARNTGADVAEDELTPEELAEAKRREQQRINKLQGPERVKYLTNGQVRRRHERDEKARNRKLNRRYRRDWMNKQQAVANLDGQVRVVNSRPVGDPLRQNALEGLIRRFGVFDDEGTLLNDPVADAVELLGAAKRAQAGKR